MIGLEISKTAGRHVIGSLIWTLQTRVGLSRKICELSTALTKEVVEESSCTSWIKRANRLIEKIKSNPARLVYRPLIAWKLSGPYEIALAFRLFCFRMQAMALWRLWVRWNAA